MAAIFPSRPPPAPIELLGEKWRELQKDAAPHQVFQSFEWCSNWARFYAKPEHGIEPCVITGYQDRELVFVWPLMKVKAGPFTLLRWLSDPFGQYGDILVARKADAQAWMASAMDLLSASRASMRSGCVMSGTMRRRSAS